MVGSAVPSPPKATYRQLATRPLHPHATPQLICRLCKYGKQMCSKNPYLRGCLCLRRAGVCTLDVELIMQDFESEEETGLYPFNAARNRAVMLAQTEASVLCCPLPPSLFSGAVTQLGAKPCPLCSSVK
jgi:hypothetical protein